MFTGKFPGSTNDLLTNSCNMLNLSSQWESIVNTLLCEKVEQFNLCARVDYLPVRALYKTISNSRTKKSKQCNDCAQLSVK